MTDDPRIPLDEYPLRTRTIEQKISKEKTGLAASLFVHVDYVPAKDFEGKESDDPLPGFRVVTGVRFSEKRKDGSSLERVLSVIGDVVTSIIREDINASSETPESPRVVTIDGEKVS